MTREQELEIEVKLLTGLLEIEQRRTKQAQEYADTLLQLLKK